MCVLRNPRCKNRGNPSDQILSAQKYKGGVRVTMLSGEKAYADYCLKHINTLGIARLLSVKPEEAGDAVVRLKQKNIEMKK